MSVPSKIALSVAVAVSSAIIGYVHYKQSADRLKLHEGVIRDVEQQQRRKHENTYTLQQQIDITKQLKAREVSSAGTAPKTTTTTAQQTVGTEEQTTSGTNLRPVMESTGIQVQMSEEQSTHQVPPATATWEPNANQTQGEAPPKKTKFGLEANSLLISSKIPRLENFYRSICIEESFLRAIPKARELSTFFLA